MIDNLDELTDAVANTLFHTDKIVNWETQKQILKQVLKQRKEKEMERNIILKLDDKEIAKRVELVNNETNTLSIALDKKELIEALSEDIKQEVVLTLDGKEVARIVNDHINFKEDE